MSKRMTTIGLAIAVAGAAASGICADEIVSPKVTTDKSVDCSSKESIIAGIIKPDMSDQEKALALFHWFQRAVFYHRYMGSDRRNVLKLINSYGYTLCGSQAGVFTHLCWAARLRARVVSAQPDRTPGYPKWNHTFAEVFYDGSWHVMDTAAGLAVYKRGDPRVLASLADIKADPTICSKAYEDGRAEPGYLAGPWIAPFSHQYITKFMKEHPDIIPKERKMDLMWSALATEFEGPADYFARAAKHWSSRGEGPYGDKYEPNVLDVNLKPGEVYNRLWGNVGKWLEGPCFKFPPSHLFSVNDPNDTVNFPYWEPYKRTVEVMGKKIITYRTYANGSLVWEPDVAEGELDRYATKLGNVVLKEGALQPEEAGKPAVIEFHVKLPYALVEVGVEATFHKGSAGDKARITIRRDSGKTTEICAATETGENVVKGIFPSRDKAYYNYRLRIEMSAAKSPGNVRLKGFKLTNLMQINMFSLPALVPGDNRVTVEVANPSALRRNPLKVTYGWAEGPGWKVEKKDTKVITKSPFTYRINVVGAKHPRMKYLKMEVLREGR